MKKTGRSWLMGAAVMSLVLLLKPFIFSNVSMKEGILSAVIFFYISLIIYGLTDPSKDDKK